MSHSRQISEASNPEEFVAIALQNRDTSAAIQSMVADAQMHPGDIVYDDPLMPTGLFPLAQIELFNNSDVTTGRLPTTPGERRGPNTGPPHDVPAKKISTPARPERDSFISKIMKSKSGESSSKSSSKSKALDGTGRDLTNTSHLPVPILRPVDRDSWTQIEGRPPTLFIREYHDRYLIPHHFGVNSSTTVSGTGTMGEDGVADDHTNLVWLPAASEEPDLELDLTPLRDSENYRIDSSYKMYAKKKIPQGSVIVEERCLIVLNETVPAFTAPEDRNLWLHQIQGTFQRVGNEGRRYLKALHPSTGGMRVLTEANHYSHHSSGPTNRRYYHVISNVRHSCNPNAELVLNQLDQSVSLKSLRKIKNREEICVSYAGMNDPRLERSMRIAYAIKCANKCDMCTPQGESNNPSTVDTTQNSDDGAQDADQYNTQNTNRNNGNPAQGTNRNIVKNVENSSPEGSTPEGNGIPLGPLEPQGQTPHPDNRHNYPSNPSQSATGRTDNSNDDSGCCGCGLFQSLRKWFSDYGRKKGIPRGALPPTGDNGNTIPDGAVTTNATGRSLLPRDSPYTKMPER